MEPEQTPKNKVNINKTWILVAVLVIVTGILLTVSLTAKNTFNKPNNSKQEKTDFVHSSLMISDAIRPSSKSGTYETDINIDSKDNKITVVQLEMSYDPKILTNVDIKPGSFITNPTVLFKKIDSSNGTITYSFAVPSGKPAVSGKGTVAVVSFSKANNTKTPLNFLPKTSLSASTTNQSVLKEMVSGIIGPLPGITNTPIKSNRPISPIPTN